VDNNDLMSQDDLEAYLRRIPNWHCCGFEKDRLARSALYHIAQRDAEIEHLRVALTAIIKHQKVTGGEMAKHGAIYQIAKGALDHE